MSSFPSRANFAHFDFFIGILFPATDFVIFKSKIDQP